MTLLLGDCREVMRTLPENHFDSIVCDPPYELGFMGKGWDKSGIAYDPAVWEQAFRVLKPGGHLLAFGGSRTYHRLACAIEDAGFEIRDQIMWVYGSGFPKSMNVGKAIDKAAGAEREEIGQRVYADGTTGSWRKSASDKFAQDDWTKDNTDRPKMDTAPATDEAKQWDGWGTALKPAHEPIVVARKPLIGTVAANVLEHGTGAINVDGCRVGTETIHCPGHKDGSFAGDQPPDSTGSHKWNGNGPKTTTGRWPANLIHDGSEEVLGLFPDSKEQQGDVRGTEPSDPATNVYGKYERVEASPKRGDSGSAARFFYCAKAPKSERNGSKHPTVKPLKLMRYLVRLVTPPGGKVLDPFMGSGTTIQAATLEGFQPTGIEQDPQYHKDAHNRTAPPPQTGAQSTAAKPDPQRMLF